MRRILELRDSRSKVLFVAEYAPGSLDDKATKFGGHDSWAVPVEQAATVVLLQDANPARGG